MPSTIPRILEAQRTFFATRATREVAYRLAALDKLEQAILAHEHRLTDALYHDFRKSAFEAYVTEISMVLGEIRLHRKRLRAWARPVRVPGTLANFPSSSEVLREPYGVALIIAPWNYPLQLLLNPLVGALSAGNCAVLKPAEFATHTSAAMAELIAATFPPEYVTAVPGGKAVGEALLEERFDTIFFTGSPALGRIVMAKAARHLTPVCLELGGKSPCIVDVDADLSVAARRIAWGKFLNAGQTCVAPDYLMVQRDVKEPFLERLKEAITAMYGENPRRSPDYPRIINDQHLAHLQRLLAGQRVVFGGEVVEAERYVAPTLLEGMGLDDPVMQEEIFGPLLPVLTFDTLEEAISQVNARPKPLALYYFSRSRHRQDRVLASTSSGGACINDTIVHLANPNLPFGGVGNSGQGSYHGWHSYDTFSHKRAVLRKPTWVDVPLRYAPYLGKLGMVKRLLG
jgi:aldehyde dehydrogenase (NAD+)